MDNSITLNNCTQEQTLQIMDMWLNGHKMDAARLYNKFNNKIGHGDKETLDSYDILAKYFKSL